MPSTALGLVIFLSATVLGCESRQCQVLCSYPGASHWRKVLGKDAKHGLGFSDLPRYYGPQQVEPSLAGVQ